ncbi:hypothetical protein CFC21_059724 [Triticum aestivum]|uniref:PPPDE domain-containing protein n=2 Tax=Triticum aestivum TaxID=4565 RepID=A0A9R1KEU7_WHEAT|nr:deSI-like protein At4g17486 [Triticum aestivum]KAF7051489.1 hypothetical protein CFC21_059724 [Triticum aestivum]
MRMRVLPAFSFSFSTAAAAAEPPTAAPSVAPAPAPAPAATYAVYLNIYDISPINNYLYWFGLGIFHSAVQVHGMEFGYGAHEYATSGVFQVEPKSCPGFIFRRSVCMGTTNMSRAEVRAFLEDLAEDYHGDTYHLIVKNCNHFTADVCKRLTGKPTPGWVNRLARLGSVCNCVLPENIKVSAVRDETAHLEFSDDDLESDTSIIDSDIGDLDHLLTTPNSDVVPPKDKTLTPGRDSL